MRGRYEIRDEENPRARGLRFSSLADAIREHGHANPLARFYIWDREVGARIGGHYEDGGGAR